jgi:hypothetical protein
VRPSFGPADPALEDAGGGLGVAADEVADAL